MEIKDAFMFAAEQNATRNNDVLINTSIDLVNHVLKKHKTIPFGPIVHIYWFNKGCAVEENNNCFAYFEEQV